MRRFLPAVLLLASPALALELFVAPGGNDQATGAADQPLATLGRAVEVVRQRRAGDEACSITLRAGTYRLAQTIELGPDDSNLTIAGATGEQVVVSGGRAVTGWEPWRDGIYQADLSPLDLPDANFLELYLEGRRQPIARAPNLDPEHPRVGGMDYNAGIAEEGSKTKLTYAPGELDPERWTHPERAIVVFWPATNYENVWAKLVQVDPAKRVLEVDHGVYPVRVGDRYYVCNLLEELDAPGEWYVDPEAKVLYYQPPAGAPQGEVVVPALTSLFKLHEVHDVHIARLDLQDCRANAVDLSAAHDCSVTACGIRNVGVGVYLGDDTHACRVAGCDITQTLGDGVSIVGHATDHERATDHVIDNNYIWDIGYGDYHNRTAGVWMWGCARCQATHNRVHDGPRYAIGMDVGNDCEIAWNIGHHVNNETEDTGIIEAATAYHWRFPQDEELELNERTNRGNQIHHNLVHDAGGYGKGPNGYRYGQYSWGIYLDTHCSNWRVYDNIVYNTVLGGFMLNCGQHNVIENNVFVDGREAQIQFNPWTDYTISDNRVEHNLFAWPGAPARLYRLNRFETSFVSFVRNLVFCPTGTPRIDGLKDVKRREAWQAWLKLGEDEGSVLADPEFVDATNHDYRLKPDSPALALGIHSVDLREAGLYAGPERHTWPCPEQFVLREEASYVPEADQTVQPGLRTYEDYGVGESERTANVGTEPGLSSVAVTEETAAAGRRSLKVVDAAGQKHPWEPYITYLVDAETGLWHGGFDLRWETGAQFVYEWRDDPYAYNLGPQVTVDAAGHLKANAKELLTLTAGRWVRFDFAYRLGEGAKGSYDLTIEPAGGEAQVFHDVACSPAFEYLSCAVIMANGDAPGVFYLDNVELRREAE